MTNTVSSKGVRTLGTNYLYLNVIGRWATTMCDDVRCIVTTEPRWFTSMSLSLWFGVGCGEWPWRIVRV